MFECTQIHAAAMDSMPTYKNVSAALLTSQLAAYRAIRNRVEAWNERYRCWLILQFVLRASRQPALFLVPWRIQSFGTRQISGEHQLAVCLGLLHRLPHWLMTELRCLLQRRELVDTRSGMRQSCCSGQHGTDGEYDG